MKKYLAFISYRHQPDSSDAALRFRSGLEGYHLPRGCSLPKRRKVFRDTDELPTSTDLGVDIENALADSEYLIALCSEEYVLSRWCLREIELFVESGRRDRILPVLISGTPETSIPEAVRDLPIAADLRADASENPGEPLPAGSLPYDRTKVKAAIPELLSLMSGMTSERIAGAEFKFRLGAAGAAAACLAAGILGFAGYAYHTANRIAENNALIAEAYEQTEKEELQAKKERDTAFLKQAEYLSEQAREALDREDTKTAVELALSALPEDLHGDLPVSAEAVGVLRAAVSKELPPSYHLWKTAETDFDIHGFYVYTYISDKMFLTEEPFGTSQPYIDYLGETGVVETDFSESRQNALDQGYTELIHLAGDVNARRHFYYGAGKPMYGEGIRGYYRVDFTLDGEPFLAAGAEMEPEYANFVAWEEPADGKKARTALFEGTAEATAELDIEGVPVSVAFSSNNNLVLVVDEAGTLHIYDEKGREQKALEGNYTDVCYLYKNAPCACAGSSDGTVSILDLASFEEKIRFQCPSPVRQIRANWEKSIVLVLCDSGVYVYGFTNGNFITEIGEGAHPNYAVFKNDRGNAGSDAEMILLIYDRKVELYTSERDVDSGITDYRPLTQEGVPKGGRMFYSQDGKRIFQHSYAENSYTYEPGEDMMFCWDVDTGDLLWKTANPWYCYRSGYSLSSDGRTIWRCYEGRESTGIERIDGITGETLLSVNWPGKFWQPMENQPVESPDGRKAFLEMQRSSTSTLNCTMMLLVFDTQTGELLWRMDLEKDSAEWSDERTIKEAEAGEKADADGGEDAGDEDGFVTYWKTVRPGGVLPKERTGFAKFLFSRDGSSIYCIQNAVNKGESEEEGVYIDRIDTETGEILDEKFLPMAAQNILVWEEEEAVVLVDWLPEEKNRSDSGPSVLSGGRWYYPSYTGAEKGVEVSHTVRIFDLAKWDYSAEIPFSYLRSTEADNQQLTANRSSDGGVSLRWEAENEDGDGEVFCCRLEKDGTLGPVCEADSEAGRRLSVLKENCLTFNGEDAYMSSSGIRRFSDGALMLSVSGNVAAAKDGSSVCVHNGYYSSTGTPYLILPSDLDTLVEKGKRILTR